MTGSFDTDDRESQVLRQSNAKPTSTRTPYIPLGPQLAQSSLSLSVAFFTLGVGTLLPFNALLSVLDFYIALFPALSAAQFVTNAYNLFFLLVGLLVAFRPPPPRLRDSAIIICLAAQAIASVLFPILGARPESFPTVTLSLTSSVFWSVLFLSATLGALNGLLQSSMYSLVALFPEGTYTTVFNSGVAVSNILAVLLRIFTRLFLDDSNVTAPAALLAGFRLFFLVCAVMSAVCIAMFLWMAHFSPEYAIRVHESCQDSAMSDDDEQGILFRSQITQVLSVLYDVRRPALVVFLCFMQTLMLFPAILSILPVALRSDASEVWTSWFPLVMVGLFAVGDLLGRVLLSSWVAKRYPGSLYGLVMLRMLSLPILIAQWAGMYTSWFVVLFLVVVHGFSNGFIMNIAFIIAPGLTEEHRRAIAGRVMFVMLISGLFAGSSLSWMLETPLKRWSSF